MAESEVAEETMKLEAWNKYQSVPPLVREEVLQDLETLNLVSHAKKIYGDDLQGVILHGKWVEGEAARSSPLELLFVMKPGVLPEDHHSRSLEAFARGKSWKRLEMSWHGRRTEAQVLAIPEQLYPCGFWHEIANGKGIILDDTDGSVRRRLEELVDSPNFEKVQ